MIACEENQSAVIRERSNAADHKPDALRREGVRTCQVSGYLGVEIACQSEFDRKRPSNAPVRSAKFVRVRLSSFRASCVPVFSSDQA
jgi:hypothetical protein